MSRGQETGREQSGLCAHLWDARDGGSQIITQPPQQRKMCHVVDRPEACILLSCAAVSLLPEAVAWDRAARSIRRESVVIAIGEVGRACVTRLTPMGHGRCLARLGVTFKLLGCRVDVRPVTSTARHAQSLAAISASQNFDPPASAPTVPGSTACNGTRQQAGNHDTRPHIAILPSAADGEPLDISDCR